MLKTHSKNLNSSWAPYLSICSHCRLKFNARTILKKFGFVLHPEDLSSGYMLLPKFYELPTTRMLPTILQLHICETALNTSNAIVMCTDLKYNI